MLRSHRIHAAFRTSPFLSPDLYELFPREPALFSRLAAALPDAIPEDHGYLIYTNQPWHPQVEFIARVLTNRERGQPWIMRRRSQAEMDTLVRTPDEASRSAQDIDPWGIFTVSVARRSSD